MLNVGSYVRIKDNYSGNLMDVKGKIGTIVAIDTPSDEAVQTNYLLDIVGSYEQESSYYPGRSYTYNSRAIVTSDELEPFSFGMKDCQGLDLEVGDKVVYSGNRPGIIEGEVVGFKDHEVRRWNTNRNVKKVQLKIARDVVHSDGKRRLVTQTHYTQWFEYSDRMRILEKNLANVVSLFATKQKDFRIG